MDKRTLSEIDKQLDDLLQKERDLSEKVSDYSAYLFRLSDQQEEFGYSQNELSGRLMDLAERYPSSFYEFTGIEEDIRYRTSNLFEIYDDELDLLKKKKYQAEDEIDAIYYQRISLNTARDDILIKERRGNA